MDNLCDILAFGAHPDDVELGCGGSLIQAADRGLRVAVADLSTGEMSTRGTQEGRQREKTEAAALMGLVDRLSLGLPDAHLGSDYSHRLPIVEAIRKLKPRIVLAPFPEDKHPDHAAAGQLVRDASYLAGVAKYGTSAPHRPSQVYHYMMHRPFEPSFVVDITDVWERKMSAIKAYESQFQAGTAGAQTAISQPGFLKMVEARAIWYGSMIGAAYGEPFYMNGPLPLSGLPVAALEAPLDAGISTYRLY
jgi:N-acetylglucosamine malate deacetylase 1